jgi:HSP20 family protein
MWADTIKIGQRERLSTHFHLPKTNAILTTEFAASINAKRMGFTISLKQPRNNDSDLQLFPEETLGIEPSVAEHVATENWGGGTEGRLSVDVFESDGEIVIRSPIAGVNTENIEVFVHNDMLTIRGSREAEEQPKNARQLVNECHWGAFSRSLILPSEIDADGISASLKNGVLTIRLPKLERSKRVSVKEI